MVYKKLISEFILSVCQTIDSVDIHISYIRMYLVFIIRTYFELLFIILKFLIYFFNFCCIT